MTAGSKLNRKYGFNESRRAGGGRGGSREKKMTDMRTSESIAFKQRRASLILDSASINTAFISDEDWMPGVFKQDFIPSPYAKDLSTRYRYGSRSANVL